MEIDASRRSRSRRPAVVGAPAVNAGVVEHCLRLISGVLVLQVIREPWRLNIAEITLMGAWVDNSHEVGGTPPAAMIPGPHHQEVSPAAVSPLQRGIGSQWPVPVFL